MDWMSGVSYCGRIKGTIVSIHSYTENQYIQTYICGWGNRCWIGFNDIYSEGTFAWIDGSVVDYTNWRSGEPNNSGGEHVVELYKTGGWNDQSSENLNYVICMKPILTLPPTCQPTTVMPTRPPSTSPTTETPTKGPTILPTSQPTYQPSLLPTLGPTYLPSVPPTTVPSLGPTLSPSLGPTHSPSHNPTWMPSSGPTTVPTVSPTSDPSLSPTSGPTTLPSVVPTLYPSESPTSSPTASPTDAVATHDYCIERVNLHIALIVIAGCLIITICALCISVLRRSDRSVISPMIFSPKGLFIERIGVRGEPEEMSQCSGEKIAIDRMTGQHIEGIPDGEANGTEMTLIQTFK